MREAAAADEPAGLARRQRAERGQGQGARAVAQP